MYVQYKSLKSSLSPPIISGRIQDSNTGPKVFGGHIQSTHSHTQTHTQRHALHKLQLLPTVAQSKQNSFHLCKSYWLNENNLRS